MAPRKEPTLKQRKFAHHYVEHGNKTEAYLHAYNVKPTTRRELVHAQAGQTYRNPTVQGYISELLEQHGLDIESVASVHAGILHNPDTQSTALRAIDIAYKLHGAYPNTNKSTTQPVRFTVEQ